MKTYQNIYQQGQWQKPLESSAAVQLVLAFGDRHLAANPEITGEIKAAYPQAEVIGCTTSGEISGIDLYDDSLCLTALEFTDTRIAVSHIAKQDLSDEEVARRLAQQLDPGELKYVLVLSDGQHVNGTALAKGLQLALPEQVIVTGGLAGDGTRFSETMVWHNDVVASDQIVVCGFYGSKIRVSHGSVGGWDPFGPERLVTKSSNNILYTLDDQPALGLYQTYLGDHAKDLPSSALLFPLMIKESENKEAVIRTILNIDESDGSMIFAGDIPQNAVAQLMKANFDRLIDGAEAAADNAFGALPIHDGAGLVLMISCVGRRLVLKQRVEEELEAVNQVFGDDWAYTGFYSYGEISPLVTGGGCTLHNQTMTVTTISECDA